MRDRDDVPYIVIEREGSGVGPFLLGAVLGAGVALLFAPRSGEETQRQIKERASRLGQAAEQIAGDLQQQFEERLDQARGEVMQKVEAIRGAVDLGREAAQQAKDELEDRISRSKAAYRAGVEGAGEGIEEEEVQGI